MGGRCFVSEGEKFFFFSFQKLLVVCICLKKSGIYKREAIYTSINHLHHHHHHCKSISFYGGGNCCSISMTDLAKLSLSIKIKLNLGSIPYSVKTLLESVSCLFSLLYSNIPLN